MNQSSAQTSWNGKGSKTGNFRRHQDENNSFFSFARQTEPGTQGVKTLLSVANTTDRVYFVIIQTNKMLVSSITRRSLTVPGRFLAIRPVSSCAIPPSKKDDDEGDNKANKLSRRQVHSSVPKASQVIDSAAPVTVARSSLVDRFIVTAEVTVSKIFPAGFGWQTASIVAAQQGFAGDSLNFALSTGLGDAIGVCLGHMTYYSAKKALVKDSGLNLTQELHTGILLGSAAFCSGTAWQPIVNALQGANLPFQQVFLGTWIGCGVAFYGGLRVARTLLSGALEGIEEPTYANSKNDASLSVAIGGATGFFVGTDAAYLPEQNFLLDVVGIQDGTPDLVGCAIAGTSTSLGFMAAQSSLNVIYPTGKCWND
jgi:hypothetical protein